MSLNNNQLKEGAIKTYKESKNSPTLMAIKFVKDNSEMDLRSAKDFVDEIIADLKRRTQYIILADNNYWYATTSPLTKDELVEFMKGIKEAAKSGGAFSPTPSGEPTQFYAYPVADKEIVTL